MAVASKGIPGGEDPLYYYLCGDNWPEAFGFEILPEWEERHAKRVEIVPRSEDWDRLESLGEDELTKICRRVFPSVVNRFSRSEHVTIRFPRFARVVEDGSLTVEMENLGFSRAPSSAADETAWSRRPRTGFFARLFRR